MHRQRSAQFIIIAFAVAVVAISASTSFGFFYTFFTNLIPAAVLAPAIGALISGVVGVLLFDLACVVWLNTFLNHAETPEQRAITLIMTVATFLGSAAASVAYLGLTATGDLALDPTTRSSIAMFALVVVIIGVVANFGSMQAYQRFSLDNKERVREADRRDRIHLAEEEQAAHLDKLIAQQVREQLTQIAPDLAQQQARRIAGQFYRNENAKYADGDGPPAALPAGDDEEDIDLLSMAEENAQNFRVRNGSGR